MQSTDITVTNVIKGIEKVKGENICILDFTEMENSVCKYFVVCDCQSNTQVNAISNSVKKVVSKNLNEKPFQISKESKPGGNVEGKWARIAYPVSSTKRPISELPIPSGLRVDIRKVPGYKV